MLMAYLSTDNPPEAQAITELKQVAGLAFNQSGGKSTAIVAWNRVRHYASSAQAVLGEDGAYAAFRRDYIARRNARGGPF